MAKKKEDNLLRDAIAEARQVKAAAIANAKIALEEAFAPHLAGMLSRKLTNEMEDHTSGDGYGKEDGGETDKKAVVEKINLSSSEIGTSDNKEASKGGRSSSDVPNPGQELDTMGKGKQGIDHKIGGTDPAPRAGTEDSSDAHVEKLHEDDEFNLDQDNDQDVDLDGGNGNGDEFGGAPDAFGGEDEFGGDQGGEDTLDLEAIIRELEADLLGAGVDGGDEMGGDEMGGAPEGDSQMGAEHEVFATEDLSQAAGKDSVDQTIEMEPHLAPEGESETLKLSEEVDEDIDLDEILREMDADGVMDGMHAGTDPNLRAKVESLQSECSNLKRSIKEHRTVVRFLKDRINEINMLNAKLLFTNKLFKGYNLNSGQKMHIVETFDRATTLREVKLIYTTLAEAYSGKSSPGAKKATSLTEGLASKAIGSTKPKSAILENTDTVKDRFKKLAGINS